MSYKNHRYKLIVFFYFSWQVDGQTFYFRQLNIMPVIVVLPGMEVRVFWWDETQGGRGAIEIISCLWC